MERFDGKLAIVTGGSRGIGAAICKRLAAGGAAVIVNHAGSADAAGAVVAEITKAGGKAEAVQADLFMRAGIDKLLGASETAFDVAFGGRAVRHRGRSRSVRCVPGVTAGQLRHGRSAQCRRRFNA